MLAAGMARRMRPWGTVLACGLVLAFASGVLAQADSDDDRDGVPDEVDFCLDTPAGDFIDAFGCSVCDCEQAPEGGAWSSRRAYQRCVAAEARTRLLDGRIGPAEFRLALKRARASSCGNADLTRCCLFRRAGGAGRCRVMAWERCDAETLRIHDAVDWDVGSCFPNPCNAEE